MYTEFSIRRLSGALLVLLALLVFSGCHGDRMDECKEGDGKCTAEDYLYEYPYLFLLGDTTTPGTTTDPAGTCPVADNTILGSCNFSHDCIDYNPSLTQSQIQGECTTLGGTYAATSCALQRLEGVRVGTCKLAGSCDGSLRWIRYYNTGYTAATAQSNCDLAGGIYIPD